MIEPVQQMERLWHAGLSADGRLCFLSSWSEDYAIVDTVTAEPLWYEDCSDDVSPTLEDWVVDGCIQFSVAPFAGRYRIFGLHHGQPLTRCDVRKFALTVDVETAILEVRDDGCPAQRLPFKAFSGDWAFASFSEDGSTIAVLEPYYVTVFREEPLRGIDPGKLDQT